MKQIKRADFKKEISYIYTCPNCITEIREFKLPEINDIIYCTECNQKLEICSVNNYIEIMDITDNEFAWYVENSNGLHPYFNNNLMDSIIIFDYGYFTFKEIKHSKKLLKIIFLLIIDYINENNRKYTIDVFSNSDYILIYYSEFETYAEISKKGRLLKALKEAIDFIRENT